MFTPRRAIVPVILGGALVAAAAVAQPAPDRAARPAAQAAAVRVTVSPRYVAPGGRITIRGTGWRANAAVRLLVGVPNSEADSIGLVRTSAYGKFAKRLRISSSAQPGTYVLLACRNQCATKATARFVVTSP